MHLLKPQFECAFMCGIAVCRFLKASGPGPARLSSLTPATRCKVLSVCGFLLHVRGKIETHVQLKPSNRDNHCLSFLIITLPSVFPLSIKSKMAQDHQELFSENVIA